MAVLIDDFTTDPAARWSARQGVEPTWDSGNSEFDVTASARWLSIYDTTTGSIEHEVQATWIMGGGSSMGMPALRGRSDATIEAYYIGTVNASTDILQVHRLNTGGASHTQIGVDQSLTGIGSADWLTVRIAAQGTAGSAVTLSVWWQIHAAAGGKPADPGWIGVDGSPQYQVTDSAASGTRLDNAAATYAGLGSHWTGSDYDTRTIWWKARAISDRAGGAGGAVDTVQSVRFMRGARANRKRRPA
jgi:hypothetical protein